MPQEPLPPLIRLKGPQGQILYPQLEKVPDGNCQISESEKVKSLLGMDKKAPGKK
jgi:hypothetical protein